MRQTKIFGMKGSKDGEFDFHLDSVIEKGLIGFKLFSISREGHTPQLILRIEPTNFEREFLQSEEEWEKQLDRWKKVGIGNWYYQDSRYEKFLKACYSHIVAARIIHQVMNL